MNELPDEAVKEKYSTADDSGSATLLVLRAGQRQPIIHVALMVHDGLKKKKKGGAKVQLSLQKKKIDENKLIKNGLNYLE